MPKLSTDTFRVEKHLRSLLGLIALVVLPPILVLLAMAKSPGVTDATALEHAQLARHIAAGDGFVTSVLRPLTLAFSPISMPQPDLVNPPLHSLLLAGLPPLLAPLRSPSEKQIPTSWKGRCRLLAAARLLAVWGMAAGGVPINRGACERCQTDIGPACATAVMVSLNQTTTLANCCIAWAARNSAAAITICNYQEKRGGLASQIYGDSRSATSSNSPLA